MTKQLLPYLLTFFMSMVGLNAFAYDIAVKNADGVTIYYRIYNGEASVTYENNPTDAFYSCYSGNVFIPESLECGGKAYRVTSIGRMAFRDCNGLTSVTIPKSVISIDDEAFWGCSRLTSITIPNSVTSIESDALTTTAWYNNQPDGLVYAGKIAYKYKGTMSANTHITIKEGTIGVAGYAFSNCSGLTSVTIPNSVKSIDYCAFQNCI